MLLVFLPMLMGLHWPQDLSDYAAQKEMRFFSLTALSGFAPLFLLQEKDAQRVFYWVVGLLGLVMAAGAAIEVVVSGALRRPEIFNTNPILLARASGFAVLLFCLLYWQNRIKTWSFVPAVALAAVGLLVSGSRGPLAALVVAGGIAIPFSFTMSQSRRRILGTVLAGAAGFSLVIFYLVSARPRIGQRLVRIFEGDWGHTDTSRWEIWSKTVEVIAETPMGVGWGRLSDQVLVYNDDVLLRHPHNIFLEIAVEAGWFALAAFLVLVFAAIVGTLRRIRRPAGGGSSTESGDALVTLASLFYWLGCAMFSGDVNDNRPLWAVLGVALAVQANRQTHDASRVRGKSDVRSG
ncbi:MAG: O-antigen ligase family protein [Kiloniellaceae bacterium]